MCSRVCPLLLFNFDGLPDDIIIRIIQYLRKKNISDLRLCNHRFKSLVDNPINWKNRKVILNLKPHHPLFDPWKLIEKRRLADVVLADIPERLKKKCLKVFIYRCKALQKLTITADMLLNVLQLLNETKRKLTMLGVTAINFTLQEEAILLFSQMTSLTEVKLDFLDQNGSQSLGRLLQICSQMPSLHSLHLGLPLYLTREKIESISSAFCNMSTLNKLIISTPIRDDSNNICQIFSADTKSSLPITKLDLGCFHGSLPSGVSRIFENVSWPNLTVLRLELQVEKKTQNNLIQMLRGAEIHCKNLNQLDIDFETVSAWNGPAVNEEYFTWISNIPSSLKHLKLWKKSPLRTDKLNTMTLLQKFPDKLLTSLITLRMGGIYFDSSDIQYTLLRFTKLRSLLCGLDDYVEKEEILRFHDHSNCQFIFKTRF